MKDALARLVRLADDVLKLSRSERKHGPAGTALRRCGPRGGPDPKAAGFLFILSEETFSGPENTQYVS
jgi:hypothetical protein